MVIMPDGRKLRRNTITHNNETREENEEEKIIKHSAFAVHGADADAADGVCRGRRAISGCIRRTEDLW